MKKNKSLRLLRSLTENEMARLEQFLESPYFNQDDDIIQLFGYLRAHHPNFDATELKKERLFARVYPGQVYDDKQWRYLNSGLNQAIEHFLAIQRLESRPNALRFALLEELSERDLQVYYRQHARNLEKDLGDSSHSSGQIFRDQLRWAEIRERHFERQRLRQHDQSILELATHLDQYYYLERLRVACALLDRQSILQGDHQPRLTAEWIHFLAERNFFDAPLIQLYFLIFRALQEEEEETHFDRLKTLLGSSQEQIASHDLKDIYLFAINYCARKIRQGKARYTREAWRLYRAGIEQEILIEQGELSPWAFTNLVKLSLRLEEYAWIESFQEQYAPLLPRDFKANALHYSRAELYYATRRYPEAQQELNQVAFSDLNYYLGARVLLAKIYYETDEEEALLSLLASFTIFLKRNKKISASLKNSCLNFCQILFQLVRRSPRKLPKLGASIQETKLLAERQWLQAQYREVMMEV